MLHGQSGSMEWLEWSGVALLRDQEETWRAVEWLVSAANGKLRGCPIGKAVAFKVKAGEARDRGVRFVQRALFKRGFNCFSHKSFKDRVLIIHW